MFNTDDFLNRNMDYPIEMSHVDSDTGYNDVRKELKDIIDKCQPLVDSGELLLGLKYADILNMTGVCNTYHCVK